MLLAGTIPAPPCSAIVPDIKRKNITFDPKDPVWRHKLWVRLNTSDGPKLFIIWSRVWKVALALMLVGWFGSAAAAWAFVKYKRGITEASYLDIAFYPLRHREYRETLSTHYFAQAERHLAAEAWSQALTNLRLAVGNNGQNLPARRQLANIYHRLQRTDYAIELLEAGLDGGAQDVEYLRELFNLLGQTSQTRRMVAIGRKLLPVTIDSNQAHREIVTQVVRAELKLKRPDQARALLEQWNLDTSMDGQLLLAEIEAATGYPDLAVLRLESLGRSQPESERVMLQKIAVYKDLGRLDEARRQAIKRVLSHPDSPGAHVDLISLLHQTDNRKAYERECGVYLERYANDTRALILLGSTAMRLREPGLARHVLAVAPRNEQGYPVAAFQLILTRCECLIGEYDAALKSAQQLQTYANLSSLDQAANNALLVWACYGLGKINDAETWLNQFLTLANNALYQQGPMLVEQLDRLGQKAAARRVLQTLLERDPKNPGYLIALVDYDFQLQDWEAVKRRLQALLNLDFPPRELLRKIWPLQDVLNLTPDIRLRMSNLLQ